MAMTSPYNSATALSGELIRAVHSDAPLTVKWLLEQGVDPNERGHSATTPLMIAFARKMPEIAHLLLDHGAEVNLEDAYQNTALIHAVYAGYKETVQRLIERGADIHHRNKAGKTALDYAEEQKLPEIAQILREAPVRRQQWLAEKEKARKKAIHGAVALKRALPFKPSPFKKHRLGK